MVRVKWSSLFKARLALATIFACCGSGCGVHQVNAIESSLMPSTVVIPTVNPIGIDVGSGRRVPKQVGLVGGAVINGKLKDNQQAAGHHYGHGHHGHGHDQGNHGFTGGHHGHDHHHHGHHGGYGDGKYFQYAHNPHYDEYEFGYRRGNDYHFQERYEKYGPYWNFKTKVKWGDKYGGYGEHYWDYNHAGSSHDGHGDGHHSEPVPSYEAQSSDKKSSLIAKRENRERMLKQRLLKGQGLNDSKRITGKIEDSQASPSTSRDRDSRDRQSQIPRPMPMMAQSHTVPSLMLDPQSGQVIDEATGKAYWLKPVRPVSTY